MKSEFVLCDLISLPLQYVSISRATLRYGSPTVFTRYEQMKRERQQSCQGRNLYVKHINPDLDDEGLQKLFDQFGTITSVKVRENLQLLRRNLSGDGSFS